MNSTGRRVINIRSQVKYKRTGNKNRKGVTKTDGRKIKAPEEYQERISQLLWRDRDVVTNSDKDLGINPNV